MIARFHTGLGKETFYKEVFGFGRFIAAMLLTLLANAAFGVTGLASLRDGAPSGLQQSRSSHFAGES